MANGTRDFPGEIETYGGFSRHLGPRFEAAGLKIQFHLNQEPGIHFKVSDSSLKEYESFILKGIKEGLKARFPNFPSTGSIWITEVTVHPIDSSPRAFYQAGRMAIEQAYFLSTLWDE